MSIIRLATRKSPLAQRQTDLTIELIQKHQPETDCEKVLITTSGDKKQSWSLSEKGGKGLFTKEIEDALLSGEADLAVHSAKDLPTDMPEGLEIIGFLPREDARDVLVMREGLKDGYPGHIASSSPRRRSQGKVMFPNAIWCEIRGNVDTRLNKVSRGNTDATFLAAAGLNRLSIDSWENIIFKPIPINAMVPAVGQGAIALQVRKGELEWLKSLCCAKTAEAVNIERTLLRLMGGGCQIAMGGHWDGEELHVFHEDWGRHTLELSESEIQEPEEALKAWIEKQKLTEN